MRIITPESHPSNIAVFTAASFYDALGHADDANARPGIQASLWFRQPAPPALDSEIKLAQEFERAMNIKTAVTSYNIIMTSRAGINSFGFYKRIPVPDDLLEPERRGNLETLSRYHGEVQLAVRHSTVGKLRKHHDRDDMEESRKAKHKYRILHARHGAGTWAYEADDTQTPWELGSGSYLFLTHRDSPVEKSLLHSNPVFELPVTARPRTVDVYDM